MRMTAYLTFLEICRLLFSYNDMIFSYRLIDHLHDSDLFFVT
jgi:hypothetical protein